jgi:hypothetical protein
VEKLIIPVLFQNKPLEVGVVKVSNASALYDCGQMVDL